jgi:hypothetical protein
VHVCRVLLTRLTFDILAGHAVMVRNGLNLSLLLVSQPADHSERSTYISSRLPTCVFFFLPLSMIASLAFGLVKVSHKAHKLASAALQPRRLHRQSRRYARALDERPLPFHAAPRGQRDWYCEWHQRGGGIVSGTRGGYLGFRQATRR